jgi:hypothetical protein
MGSKKRSNNPVLEIGKPVKQGNVFATFLEEAQQLGREVVARRAFDEAVGAFLKEKGLVEEFETFRAPKSDDGQSPV